VCGDDAEVARLPADEGFSPDEFVCVRCGDALLRPAWPLPGGRPDDGRAGSPGGVPASGQARSA
jgi:hypothetical protein